ncbi:MAG: hypothetical protein J1E95_04210 [Muribaculaceae bacterium]|nr:hypothetical protein [Muribaculaceae bacterium]
MSSVSRSIDIKYDHIPQDGKNGKDSYSLVCNPSVLTIPCSANGAYKNQLTSYSFKAQVLVGGQPDSGWRFGAAGTGCQPAMRDNGDCWILSMSADQATVAVTAVKNDITLSDTVSLVKVYDGAQGNPGANGTNGTNGTNGPLIPNPMRWMDYPFNYRFQAGNVAAGETRLDVVLANEPNEDGSWNTYRCIKSHVKSAEPYGSPITDKATQQKKWNHPAEWWAPGDAAMNLVASMLLLAKNAYIGLLSGNQILIMDKDSNIVGAFSSVEGAPAFEKKKLPLFVGGKFSLDDGFLEEPGTAIDQKGNIYSGSITGRRVVINAEAKDVEIYDDDGNLCTILSGDPLTRDEVENSKDEDKQIILPALMSGTTSNFPIASESSGTGTIKFHIPSIRVTARKGNDTASNIEAEMRQFVRLTANLWVGHVKYDQLLADIDLQTYKGIDVAVGQIITELTPEVDETFQIRKSDKYSITLALDYYLGTDGTATTQQVVASTSIVIPSMRTFYGKTGWFSRTDNKNYIYAIIDNGVLVFKVVSNGVVVFDSSAAGKHF